MRNVRAMWTSGLALSVLVLLSAPSMTGDSGQHSSPAGVRATTFHPFVGSAPPPGTGPNHTAVLAAVSPQPRVGSFTSFELNISNAICGGQIPSPGQMVNEVHLYFGNGAVIREPGETSGPTCNGPSPYELIPFAIAYQTAGTLVANATVIFLDGEVVASNAVMVTVQPAVPSEVPAASLTDLIEGAILLGVFGTIAAGFRRFVKPTAPLSPPIEVSERRERIRQARGPVTGVAGLAMIATGVYLCTTTIHALSRQLLSEIWASGNPSPVGPTTTFLPVAALGIAGIVFGGVFLTAAVLDRESIREKIVEDPRIRRRGWAIGVGLTLVIALLAASSVLVTVPVAHPFSTTITGEPLCGSVASASPLTSYSIAAPAGSLVVYAWQTSGGQALGDFAILPAATPMESTWSSNWDIYDASGYGWFNASSSPVVFGVCSLGPTASGAPSSLTINGYYYSPWL